MVEDPHIIIQLLLALIGGITAVVVANWREHRQIHSKIDKVHHSLRDRLEAIWRHMNGKGPEG